MPGKRPRQIQRTTSLSQLGTGLQLLDGVPMVPGRPKTASPACRSPAEGPQIASLPWSHMEDVPIEDAISEGGDNGNAHIAQQCSDYPEESMALDVIEEHVLKKSEEMQAAHLVNMSTVAFLEVCFLCKRRLRQGKDIYMYRGDQAFCSIECRCYQIEADERRERCKITSVKKGTGAPAATSGSTSQQVVSNETAAAA